MKTLLVSVFHNNQSMNFLTNDSFEILAQQPNLKLVILCPSEKLDFYKEHYSRPKVVFDVYQLYQPSKLDDFFDFLLFSMINTKAIHYRQKYVLYLQGGWFRYLIKRLISLILGRYTFIRMAVRWLDNKLVKTNDLDEVFNKHQPDAVLVLDILHQKSIRVLRTAKKFKVFSIGLVRGWDNLTSKGAVRVIPDKVVVQTEQMKKEAMRLGNIKSENIYVSGVQVFDKYHNFKPSPKEEFYKKVGADINKRLILFSPYFGQYSTAVEEIIEIMDQGVKNGQLPADVQFLVRFPPIKPGQHLQRLDSKNMVYYIPGIPFDLEDKLELEFTGEDIQILADSMYYCPVTINFASTMTVDAAAFDTPIINLAFDGYKMRPFKNSIRCVFNYDHYQPILKSGGIRMAHSKEEMFKWINHYLEHPEADREGRRKIIKDFCGQIDGLAGKRIADYILNQLKI